ncbi:hypothetical protein GINT2_000076 [Glugoides intestinalis]
MSVAPSFPKRSLPRYQNARSAISKKNEKKAFTHQEFISFVEPFYAALKAKHYAELKKMSKVKKFDFDTGIYTRLSELLCEKLMSAYSFKDDIQIEDISFDTPLELKTPIKLKSFPTTFFEKNRILENYRENTFNNFLAEYEAQVGRNNRRRRILLEELPKLCKMPTYFYLFDQINTKLEDVYKRAKNIKKSTKFTDIDKETIREYLERIREFFDEFDQPDQFSNVEPSHKTLFDEAVDEEYEEEIQFFK